jgi:hypothetical protein
MEDQAHLDWKRLDKWIVKAEKASQSDPEAKLESKATFKTDTLWEFIAYERGPLAVLRR